MKDAWNTENATWAQKEKVQIQGEGSQGKPTLLTPWSCTFSFQNCEKINFCCLIHPVCGILSWKPYQPKTDAQYGKVEKGPTILIHQDKNYVPVSGGGLLLSPSVLNFLVYLQLPIKSSTRLIFCSVLTEGKIGGYYTLWFKARVHFWMRRTCVQILTYTILSKLCNQSCELI